MSLAAVLPTGVSSIGTAPMHLGELPPSSCLAQRVAVLSAFAAGALLTLCMHRRRPRRQVPLGGRRVPVIGEANISLALLDRALAFVPFKAWLSKLERNSDSFSLHRIYIQSVDMFGNRVGFVKLKSEVTDRDGDSLAGICFLRGGSVAVLVILECAEDGFEHCVQVQIDNVCTAQPRNMALPAGMLDGNGDFSGAMAREMEEETGIKCDAANLVDMTALAYGEKFEGMYPSVGACDEFIRLFLFKRVMPQRDIAALEGRLMGLREENEKIRLCLVPLKDLWRLSSDSKALSALLLYSKLKETGQLV